MIDTLLQNRYRLEAELGRGGMGTVYRAYDTLLDRAVAVKVVSNSTLGTEGRARLLREARAAAKLNHPNILAVHDAGEVDGLPFIVMELIEGQTLREHARPTIGETIEIAQQICAALDHAHAKGIIHRDLKPENVMLVEDPHPLLPSPLRPAVPPLRGHGKGEGWGVRVKLMDFGLAFSLSASRFTQDNMLVGTMAYLAPELIEGKPASPASDLYALGAMLYELTAGCLPFASEDLATLLAQHLHVPVSPVSTHNQEIMPALDLLIMRLLAKQPEQRPASAQEVQQILFGISAGEAVVQPAAEIPRNNLPAQLTSFIGREKDIAEVKQLLSASRLVTLIGSGGAGKTRLSIQAAAEVLNNYQDGVWFVELAALTDPALIPQTVAVVLDLREEAGRLILAVLTDYLRAKTTLIILDNCEHLIEGCAQFANALLRAAPQVKFLASSREPLNIGGEATYGVPSLAAPDPQRLPPLETLTQYEAVRLFAERAKAALPSFEVSDANAPAVAQICYRLDGIPLALELAAARVRGLKVEQIAQRLSDRFRLLASGSRTALPHHQTLRALIDWSYDLLTEQERILFRRLSVFAGGWTIEAAEAVGTGDGLETFEVLDALLHLVDKSLINMDEQSAETRYHMLETIRQYAQAKLSESSEIELIRHRHLNFFCELAETIEPKWFSANREPALDRLTVEHDNLRAALGWAAEHGKPEIELRLAGALFWFWYHCGDLIEGHRWLEEALLHASVDVPVAVRAKALLGSGHLAFYSGSLDAARIRLEESARLWRDLGNQRYLAYTLIWLETTAGQQGDCNLVRPGFEESIALFRTVGDEWGLAVATMYLGIQETKGHTEPRDEAHGYLLLEESETAFRRLGDQWQLSAALYYLGMTDQNAKNVAMAQSRLEESLMILRQVGDKLRIADISDSLGDIARAEGNFQRAAALYTESLARRRDLGGSQGYLLSKLGYVSLALDDLKQALAFLRESLQIALQRNETTSIPTVLTGIAGIAYAEGNAERSMRLLVAVKRLMETIKQPKLELYEQTIYDRNFADASAQLGETIFNAVWTEGSAMTMEQAVAYALEGVNELTTNQRM